MDSEPGPAAGLVNECCVNGGAGANVMALARLSTFPKVDGLHGKEKETMEC